MKQILAITFLACLWYCLQQWPDTYVHVVFCDVGQGDGILVSSGHTQLVIDGGPDSKILDCLHRHLPFWDRRLEFVLASHADKDHIGGLLSILDLYDVKTFIFSPSDKKSAENQLLHEKVLRNQSQGMTVITAQNGASLKLSPQVSGQILIPFSGQLEPSLLRQSSLKYAEETEAQLWDRNVIKLPTSIGENDRSIILYLHIGSVSYLFTGDIEIDAQKALLERGVIKDIDVLKISHHGAKNGTSPEFLMAAEPEIAVVSSGKKNPYGHPHPSVLSLLDDVGAQVLRTDILGTLETVTDGRRVWYVR